MSWNTSAMPHTMSDPVTRAGSPMETGSRAGVAPTAPDSYTSTRRGAWVARARLHARLGRPIPTNTTSPSTSSRAATLAIISSAVYAPSEPVIHPGAAPFLRLEPRGQIRLFLHERRLLLHAEQAPDLGIPLGVGALRVDDAHVGVQRRHGRERLTGVRAGHVPDPRVHARQVGPHIVAQRPEGEPGGARREARDHAEVRVLLDLQPRRAPPLHRTPECMQ